MNNPIPNSNFWATPTLEDLWLGMEALPAKDKAQVYNYVMMAMNACHKLVADAMNKETV